MAALERLSPETRITLVYLALGVTWIVASDLAVALTTAAPVAATISQLLKGLLFIAVTGLVLYLLIARQMRCLRLAQAETDLVYRRTMSAVTHLMNDHLNTMLFFKLKADEGGAIDARLSRQWETMLFDTSTRIRHMGELEQVDAEVLERFLASGGGTVSASAASSD